MRILRAQIHLTPQGPSHWSKSAGRSEVLSAQPWGFTGTLSFTHPEAGAPVCGTVSFWGQLRYIISGFSLILAQMSKHCLASLLPFLSCSPVPSVSGPFDNGGFRHIEMWLWSELIPWQHTTCGPFSKIRFSSYAGLLSTFITWFSKEESYCQIGFLPIPPRAHVSQRM